MTATTNISGIGRENLTQGQRSQKLAERLNRTHVNTGQLFAGRFQLIKCIGIGGQGVVFKAIDTKSNPSTFVALKISLNNQWEMSKSEAAVIEALNATAHPFIPVIHAAYETTITAEDATEDPSYLLAIEFIEGRSLAQKLSNGPL